MRHTQQHGIITHERTDASDRRIITMLEEDIDKLKIILMKRNREDSVSEAIRFNIREKHKVIQYIKARPY